MFGSKKKIKEVIDKIEGEKKFYYFSYVKIKLFKNTKALIKIKLY